MPLVCRPPHGRLGAPISLAQRTVRRFPGAICSIVTASSLMSSTTGHSQGAGQIFR